MRTYVTFGQDHVHILNGKRFDKDCIAVIEAKDRMQGRGLAFEYFGERFCTTHTDIPSLHHEYYPRGFIEV